MLPLIIVGIGFALMVGALNGGTALRLLGMLFLVPILWPFASVMLKQLPPWVSWAVLIWIGLVLLRGLATLLIGARGADTMVGGLAADLVRFVLRLFVLPLRLFRRL